jgi:hypothetical protein
VFSGLDSTLLASFFAYDAGFVLGVFVAAGNINQNSPFAEIVTGTSSGAPPHVRVFNSQGLPLAGFFAYQPWLLVGVRVALTDINQDGRLDIVTTQGHDGHPVVVGDSGLTLQLIDQFYALQSIFRNGLYVAAG